MKALVLSGGGALGAYEAGVAYALMQREEFDLLCGVSIGAINVALLSAGEDGTIREFWCDRLPARAPQLFPHIPRLRQAMEEMASLGRKHVLQDALSIARIASLFPHLRSLGRLHKTVVPAVAQELGQLVDFSRRRHTLLIGATNVSRGTGAVFGAGKHLPEVPPQRVSSLHPIEYHTIEQQNFLMILLASSAMPGVFSPIELEFDGQRAYYADGCIMYTSPLGLAIDYGATEITVIFVNPEPSGAIIAPQPDVARMAFNIATLWGQRMLDYELRLVEATNELIRLGALRQAQDDTIVKRPLSIRHVRPSEPLDLDMLGFDDAAGSARAFERGMQDGARQPKLSIPLIPLPQRDTPPMHWLRRIWSRSA
jgi:predicted acylesterase/phospholipase RssA